MSALTIDLLSRGPGAVPAIRITAHNPESFEGQCARELLIMILEKGGCKVSESGTYGETANPNASQTSITIIPLE